MLRSALDALLRDNRAATPGIESMLTGLDRDFPLSTGINLISVFLVLDQHHHRLSNENLGLSEHILWLNYVGN